VDECLLVAGWVYLALLAGMKKAFRKVAGRFHEAAPRKPHADEGNPKYFGVGPFDFEALRRNLKNLWIYGIPE